MATVSTTPSTYYNFFKTTLKRSMTSASQTSGIVLDKILDNEGAAVTFTTTPLLLTIEKADKKEIISAGGFTQDADGNFTLTDVTRDLPWDGSSFTGQGSPVKFTAKAVVYMSLSGQTLSDLAFLSAANTFAGTATFTEAPVFSNGTKFSAFANTTARDAYFTSPANGDMCFVTGTGMQYYDGAWNTFGTSTVSNAAEGTKGVVDIASAAEIGAGTATDGSSGAINVIPVSQTAKTSSGAGDENKVPVLQSDGALHINHIATGTPDGTKFVRDDGVLALPNNKASRLESSTAIATMITGTSSETTITDTEYDYTIGANTLAVGDLIVIKVAGLLKVQAGGENSRLRFKIDSNTVADLLVTNTGGSIADCYVSAEVNILVRSIGVSGKVDGFITTNANTTNTLVITNPNQTSSGGITVDTTGSLDLDITTQHSTALGVANHNTQLYMAHFSKLSA